MGVALSVMVVKGGASLPFQGSKVGGMALKWRVMRASCGFKNGVIWLRNEEVMEERRLEVARVFKTGFESFGGEDEVGNEEIKLIYVYLYPEDVRVRFRCSVR
ncbi:hypothetical protein E3N88_44728 [Mikania micrantha]|uniref:Uncharacterized protein n=1 Tax=Mikania micrantha TaxID=192012 RepID=A0A5N6LB59_9ASTR|nr:hypothetical protein E3N88_44728 [Mikania micrantha]